MQSDVTSEIKRIVERRKVMARNADSHLARWATVQSGLAKLRSLAVDLPSDLHDEPAVLEALADLGSQELRDDLQSAVSVIEAAKRRFARNTLNIGVSGQARTGKSTLLQSISGLGDEQIPTGSGLPVTAVRSRIFHATRSQAVLTMHTFSSFAADVLGPLHTAVGLIAVPQSLSEYRSFSYPEATTGEQRKNTLLQRLRSMQKSLSTYEHDLTGGQCTVPLGELRPYVAYPTREQEEETDSPPRRYLAVRDARIEVPFPHPRVAQLGIIDLPGLGEVNAEAEARHVKGLSDDVDLVILLKRPLEGVAYWRDEDASAVSTLDSALSAGTRRDFVFILINHFEGEQDELVRALRHSILTTVNAGHPDKHFRVIEADASKSPEVSEQVLGVALEHLAETLPRVDQEAWKNANAVSRAVAGRMREAVKRLEQAMAGSASVVGSVRADVSDRARELRKDLSVQLGALIERLELEARSQSDEQFAAMVAAADTAARDWIESGYDAEDADAWRRNAHRNMSVQAGSGKVAEDAFNVARIGIAERYAGVDEYLNDVKVGELNAAVESILGSQFDGLMGVGTPSDRLKHLADVFADAPDPCRGLSQALSRLLALHFDFKYQTYPRIRASLDRLRLMQPDPDAPPGQATLKPQTVVHPTEEGAGELQTTLRHLAIQASYQTMNAVLSDAGSPAVVIHAAAELFDDAFIRNFQSEQEFDNAAHAFRDEIWPGVYSGLDSKNARVRALRQQATDLTTALNSVGGAV